MKYPDRIYGWLNTQMSIARFFGGRITLGGDLYVVAQDEPGQPLVRASVLDGEKKARRKAERQERNAMPAYPDLFQRGPEDALL